MADKHGSRQQQHTLAARKGEYAFRGNCKTWWTLSQRSCDHVVSQHCNWQQEIG